MDERSSRRHLQAKATKVAQRLDSTYGTPDLGNKVDPLDELVYIALTRQTHEMNAQRTWNSLVAAYPRWEMLLDAPEEEVASVIADGGFSKQKARWIQQSLRIIKESFGNLSLAPLERLDDAQAERFLCALPGIKTKSAKCILMYSLGRQVLPVDTHVRRVSERLGLVEPGLSSKRIHQELEDAVPRGWHYSYHVNAVVHGRKVCIVAAPRCGQCALRQWCSYYHTNIVAAPREEEHGGLQRAKVHEDQSSP